MNSTQQLIRYTPSFEWNPGDLLFAPEPCSSKPYCWIVDYEYYPTLHVGLTVGHCSSWTLLQGIFYLEQPTTPLVSTWLEQFSARAAYQLDLKSINFGLYPILLSIVNFLIWLSRSKRNQVVRRVLFVNRGSRRCRPTCGRCVSLRSTAIRPSNFRLCSRHDEDV